METNSTELLKPLRCIQCLRVIAFVDGTASVKCRHCQTITLFVTETKFVKRIYENDFTLLQT